MSNSFSFNGVRKPYLFMEKGRKKSIFAPVKRNLLSIPGMIGALLDSTDTDVLTISQPVYIKGVDKADLKNLEEDMAGWLITDNPVELIFDDEPGRIYYAVVEGSFEPDHIVNFGSGTITFICLDPYRYGVDEKKEDFPNESSFLVEGTAETYPVIDVQIADDTTFVAVLNGDKLNLVGMPAKQEETPVAPETTILNTTCNSLTGWTVSSAVSIPFGDLMGTLKTNGSYFYSDSFGSSTAWHGPAMKTGLSEAVQDFRFDAGFYLGMTAKGQSGGVSVALLDANSQVLAELAIFKHYPSLDTVYGRVLADNSKFVIDEGSAQFNKNFGGIFRVYRKGNVWTAEIYRGTSSGFQKYITKPWTDVDEIAMAPVTQVQVRLLQRANISVADMHVDDIQVYKLNDVNEGQVPIIAHAGDIVTFDHQTNIIRKNGEDITKEKAFIGEYFPLTPGVNDIVVEPAESIMSTEVRWRNRWR